MNAPQRISNADGCMIHMAVSVHDESLIKPQSYTSWLAILEAAKVRNYGPVKDRKGY